MGIPQICGEHPGVPEKVTPYYDPQVGMQLSNLYLSCIPLNRENFFRLGESLGWGERLLEQFDRYNQKLNARNPSPTS